MSSRGIGRCKCTYYKEVGDVGLGFLLLLCVCVLHYILTLDCGYFPPFNLWRLVDFICEHVGPWADCGNTSMIAIFVFCYSNFIF